MKNRGVGHLLGMFGVVIFAFGLLAYSVFGGVSASLALSHIVGGLILILVWLLFAGAPAVSFLRDRLSSRELRPNLGFSFLLLLLVAGIVSVNFLGARYDYRIDFTEQRIHSLSQQSVEIVRSLRKPLELVLLDGGEQTVSSFRKKRLLSLYQRENPDYVSVRTLNPIARPDLLEQFQLKPGQMLIARYGEGQKRRLEHSPSISEESVTSAIFRLVRGELRKIYFIAGHDEPEVGSVHPNGLSKFVEAVQQEHLQVETLVLAEAAEMPEDAAAVLLVGPRAPLADQELEKLKEYIERGGRLLVAVDPQRGSGVIEFLSQYGVVVSEDVIIDKANRPLGTPQLGAQPLVRSFSKEHPVTRKFPETAVTVFNIASSVIPGPESAGYQSGEKVVPILKSSKSAWAERDVDQLFGVSNPKAEIGANDEPGPVTMAVAREWMADGSDEKELSEKATSAFSKLVVVGDTDWILNANLSWYSNRDLALNMVGWLSDVKGGVTLRPKTLRLSVAAINRNTYLAMMLSSFLLPEMLFLLGLAVWWRRRLVS